MRLRNIIRYSYIARQVRRFRVGGKRFLRLYLNVILLILLPSSVYKRLPDGIKDARAMILRCYHGKGSLYFVQVGSNDGIRRDPIHRFVKRYNWHGIMIEPVASIFSELVANFRGNPNIHFENVAIAEERGSLSFYSLRSTSGALPEWHDQIGSLLPETLLRYRDKIPDIEDYIVEEKVQAITYDDLMKKHGEPQVDFLHIDTEGYDFRILEAVGLERRQPLMIMYENVIMSEQECEQCEALLLSAGYSLIDQGPDTFAYLSNIGDRP